MTAGTSSVRTSVASMKIAAGFVCLEVDGHFDWLPPEARDGLFAGQLRPIARTSGLPGLA